MAQVLSFGVMTQTMMQNLASVQRNGRDNRTNFVSASVYNVGHRNTKELKEKEINKMDRYLLIELGSDGLAFETAQFDFYASWLGIGIAIVSVVAYKIYKNRK